MKIPSILLLIFTCISSTSGQERNLKNVGVIYELADSISQKHVGLTMFENFVKSYPQHDSINIIIEELLDKEIKQINGFDVHKIAFNEAEINNMIKKKKKSAISAYDMIMIIKDLGFTTYNGYLPFEHEGRGLNSGSLRRAEIYANLGVELINISNGKRRNYDFYHNLNYDFEWHSNAVVRIRRNYFSRGENKKELSDEKLIDMQENLLEMYRLQIKELFNEENFFTTVSELFEEEGE